MRRSADTGRAWLLAAAMAAGFAVAADPVAVGRRASAEPFVGLPPAPGSIGAVRRAPDGSIVPARPAGSMPSARAPRFSARPIPALQETPPGWIADARTGCQIWNADPQPDESITWSGACAEGRATGPGILQWFENGQPTVRYEGEYREGRANGRAIYVWPDGARYEGDYLDDRWNGRGVFIWAEGERYDGEWQDGQQTGQGIYTWPDGGRYEGEWREGQRHGRGIHIWSNGYRYEGEWRDDVPHGNGTFWGRDGAYSGTWESGCFRDGSRRAAIVIDGEVTPCQ